ncbi:MAG: T9SS type A sorting domain-containing protein [Bacteroidales bacterium]|nr:T9SS type A sorting domain-containing protein [Bacteroidales bacterium]
MKTKHYSQMTKAGKGLMIIMVVLFFNSLTFGQNTTLTLLSPNGGENWLQGSTCTISWEYTGEPATGLIEYSEDGGQYWNYLDFIYAIDSVSSYTFQNYLYTTTQAMIRISDYNDPTVTDESDSFFTVTEPPVYIYSPYYGDFYYRTAPVYIDWYSYTLTDFTLDYSLDNGTTWTNIISNYSGFDYTWTAPDVLTDQAVIRIADATDSTSYGLSPVFSIVELPTISLTSPNGGEVWNYSEIATVSWTGTNLPAYVYIDFSADGGQTWSGLGYGYGTETGGNAEVYVPYISTTTAMVRVYDYYYDVVMDESDQMFTVNVPPVIVYYPYEGYSFYNKSQTYLSWLAADDISLLNIDLSSDNGQTWQTVAQDIDATQYYYYWTVMGTPSESCVIRISDAADPSRFGLSAMFTILETPVITLSSPLGGEIWNTGSAYNISWSYDNPSAYYVYLEYSADNGQTWNYISYVVIEDIQGSYEWITPDISSNQCLIRVSDYYLDFVSDTSNVFSILTYPETPICMVSVDSTTNYNVIVWEKPVSSLIDKFIVYKESDEAGIYEPIGIVNYSDLAVFTDTNSNPNMKSYRYELGFEDADGHIFPAGDLHQTIHLSINQGVGNSWNLIWTDYIGFDVATYNIYRKTDVSGYNQIATISASFNSYTDLEAPVGNVYYIVEVINPAGCNPVNRSTDYGSSYSNVATNNVLGVSDPENDVMVSIYPNPANERLNIRTGETLKGNTRIELSDLLGKIVYADEISGMRTNSSYFINTTDFKDGLYVLKVSSESGSISKKIVIRH